jgi:hypothetical protein
LVQLFIAVTGHLKLGGICDNVSARWLGLPGWSGTSAASGYLYGCTQQSILKLDLVGAAQILSLFVVARQEWKQSAFLKV